MNLKAFVSGFDEEKYESKLLSSLLRHQRRLSRLFIVAFGLNKKISCERLIGGGGVKVF